MSAILVQDTTITARDGFPLAATVYIAAAVPRVAVLINSARAVPRKIYRGFASYLAEHDCAVVSYDYRGTGGSRPPRCAASTHVCATRPHSMSQPRSTTCARSGPPCRSP